MEVSKERRTLQPRPFGRTGCALGGNRRDVANEHLDLVLMAVVGNGRRRVDAGRYPANHITAATHVHAVVAELAHHTADQNWWLGYLDTDVDELAPALTRE
jgi:hypothetical protein